MKILVAALALGALVACFVSFFVAAHSFVALLSTAYAPETSRRKKILLQLVPFLIVTPFVHPPEKKKSPTVLPTAYQSFCFVSEA